jgi:putative ABC transport system permease protein
MKQLAFYFRYGWQNIRRGGRWTTLAIFCIAAGVATIVALRSLGLAIGESMVGNVRQDNKGDVRLIKDRDGESQASLLLGSEEVYYFSDEELSALENYVAQRGGQTAQYTRGGGIQITGLNSSGLFGTAQFVTTYLIDPATYPPTHTITAINPAGVPLEELFTGGAQIVISENMAESQNLTVGDSVRIARTDVPFEIVGIVDTSVESSLRNLFAAFFGFAYIDLDAVREYIDPAVGVNALAIAFDVPLTIETEKDTLRDLRELARLTTRYLDIESAVDTLEENEAISRLLGDFIVVLGLGALLIGGVGIMNTMLVLVRRRTNEIAALKTFGLKGGQIAMLFFAENVLLGLIGSVIGIIAGLLLGGIVNQFGEEFIKQDLAWRVYPEAIWYGFALGMVTTAIFGLAPIQTALQVRPASILRPNDNQVPRLGILRGIGLVLLMVILIGLVVGRIVQPSFGLVNSFDPGDYDPFTNLLVPTFGVEGAIFISPYLASIIGVAVTLLILGILVMMLWVVVWLIGKLPAFGSVDLRLALRNLSTHRWRTATTLLALSAGMFALSSITFVGAGTRELLNVQLSQQFGGNVLAFPITPSNETIYTLVEGLLSGALADVPGVEAQTSLGIYDVDLVSVDGVPVAEIEVLNADFEEEFNTDTIGAQMWNGFVMWTTNNAAVYDTGFPIVAGRNLTLEDRGQHIMIGPEEGADALDVGVGSILEYRVNGTIIAYELVGIFRKNGGFIAGGPVIPPDSVGGENPEFQFFTFQVDEAHVGQAVAELSAIRVPPTIAVDVGFFDSLLSRIIDQFSALPTIVGFLSLIAAAVIMANTVALATLERRQQIGILKSLGLKSYRVLLIMLIESILIGLLSAVLGIGLSWGFISLFGNFTGTPLPLPLESQLVAIALVLAAIAISAASTFLSANVAVRERVMNVLRYE